VKDYEKFLMELLHEKQVTTVLDLACGTGDISVRLLEQGFKVTSSDASYDLLKEAIKTRWSRRMEKEFDEWIIEEINWKDVEEITKPEAGFDACILLGSSFSAITPTNKDLQDQIKLLNTFKGLLKPGGTLIIDHMNFDNILRTGNIGQISDISTQIVYVDNKPSSVILDNGIDKISYHPHTLEQFTELLKGTFGEDAEHQLFGDFKIYEENQNSSIYFHVMTST